MGSEDGICVRFAGSTDSEVERNQHRDPGLLVGTLSSHITTNDVSCPSTLYISKRHGRTRTKCCRGWLAGDLLLWKRRVPKFQLGAHTKGLVELNRSSRGDRPAACYQCTECSTLRPRRPDASMQHKVSIANRQCISAGNYVRACSVAAVVVVVVVLVPPSPPLSPFLGQVKQLCNVDTMENTICMDIHLRARPSTL